MPQESTLLVTLLHRLVRCCGGPGRSGRCRMVKHVSVPEFSTPSINKLVQCLFCLLCLLRICRHPMRVCAAGAPVTSPGRDKECTDECFINVLIDLGCWLLLSCSGFVVGGGIGCRLLTRLVLPLVPSPREVLRLLRRLFFPTSLKTAFTSTTDAGLSGLGTW